MSGWKHFATPRDAHPTKRHTVGQKPHGYPPPAWPTRPQASASGAAAALNLSRVYRHQGRGRPPAGNGALLTNVVGKLRPVDGNGASHSGEEAKRR